MFVVFAGDHLQNLSKQLSGLPALITDGGAGRSGAGLDVGLFGSVSFFLYSPSVTMFPHLSFHTLPITRSEMCVVCCVGFGCYTTLRGGVQV